jgi:hypothetical protein
MYDRAGGFIGVGEVCAPGDVAPRRLVSEAAVVVPSLDA